MTVASASGAVELLKLKAANPALWNLSARRRIPTNDDAHLYAFLRTSADDKQRILALFNFGGEAADASIDLNAIDYKQLRPLAPSSPELQETKIEQGRLHTAIGKYGWRLFLVAVE
jgi:hypothetical protein